MKVNHIKIALINYFLLLAFELIFKFFVLKTYDIGIFYVALFTLPLAFLITLLMHLFKSKIVNKIISIIIYLIILFIFLAETVYFSFYKTICGLSALSYGGQVMEFANSIMMHIKSNISLIIIFIIPIILCIILVIKNVFDNSKYNNKDLFFLLFSTMFFAFSSLELNLEKIDSAKSLFYETNDLIGSTNKFGLLTSINLDSIKVLSKFEENIEIAEKLEFTKDDRLEYNVINIDFPNLISKEKDETVKNMHKYFNNEVPTNKNEYTGMFAGKNLVFIVAEGFYPIAVDKNITPTLYKLVNNGFIFKNYYQPIYNCSTSDGEFISQLSILPGVATCSMKETDNNYLPYAVGNIFKKYQYDTYAFHGWTYSYYGRQRTLPNLGYKYYGYDRYKTGYKNALKGIKDSWPTSDVDVINASYGYYSSSLPFATYYMSISGHLEYNFTGGNAMSSKNKNVVKNMKASEKIKAYVASQVEFDRSLKLLMANLERDNLLDDTVFVITADHYPYGLTNKDIESYVDWMKNPNFDLYKNNLIIYNSQMENVVVEKYTSGLDVLPTILNLFGIEYDSRLLIGHDIFSNASDLVIFNNKSWITDKGRYDYLKKSFEPFTDEELPKNYVSKINEIVKLKFQMSKLLISKDYYRKTLGG